MTSSHWQEGTKNAGGRGPFIQLFGPDNRRAHKPGRPGEKAIDEGAIDMRDGGTAIPYWDEDPFIRQEYEQFLKDGGVPSQMDPSLYVDPLKT